MINYYTKTGRFMRINHAVWVSAAASWPAPPTSHFIDASNKSSLQPISFAPKIL